MTFYCVRCVLTPNSREFDRLVNAALAQLDAKLAHAIHIDDLTLITKRRSLINRLKSPVENIRLDALAAALRVTIILKGRFDKVSVGSGVVFVVQEEGAPRRCGGQVRSHGRG